MSAGPSYCRYCEEQIEGCLTAAREEDSQRTYFLTLAWRWARLARDLENRHSCGAGCPLRKSCMATLPTIIEPAVAAMAQETASLQSVARPSVAVERPSIPTA
jgi:hypothetical protein